MLTNIDKKLYTEEGYCIVRNLIPAAMLTPLRDTLVSFQDDVHGWDPDQYFQALDPSRFKNRAGGPLPFGVQRPAAYSQLFRDVADHGNLRCIMATLLNGPVQRFTDQALVKWVDMPGDGGATHWHQDSYYWHIDPELGCNCWIALDDVGPDSIAVAVMPGSQHSGQLFEHESYFDDPGFCGVGSDQLLLRHRIPYDQADPTKEVLVSMAPGDGLFFSNYTWHRAEPNRMDVPKCAYAVAYKRAAAAGRL